MQGFQVSLTRHKARCGRLERESKGTSGKCPAHIILMTLRAEPEITEPFVHDELRRSRQNIFLVYRAADP